MYIKRSIEEVLRRRANNSKCLLLTGARQVGKSTLLKALYPGVPYITFDDKLLLSAAIDDPKLFLKSLQKPSILDEIQYASDIFPYIKIECDRSDKYANFYLTGSQQMKMMSKVQESLAGRVSILELQTLSMRELNGISFNRHFVPTEDYISEREGQLKPYESVWKTIHRGMYPELHVSEREWMDFYSSYVRTYLERDIKDEIGVKDEMAFTKFLSASAARTGQMLNYTSIAEEAGVSVMTIKKSAKPNKSMAAAFSVLDNDIDKKRGMGAIICLYDQKLYLKDDLVVLPIEYI